MDDVLIQKFERAYRRWKERLLDLTGRNRLLNFRPTKVSTIRVTSPEPGDLFEQLVVRERSLRFPLYQGTATVSLADDVSEGEMPAEETYNVSPGDMETSKPPPELERSLYRLAQLARFSKEERGVNTLYLAIGMLEWRPQEDKSPQKSPLLLVPVELKRENHLAPYVLSLFDEDPEVNPSLVFMLRNDFDFDLPAFPEQLDAHSIDAFLSAVGEAASPLRWSVLPEVWLGQFQFRKLAMYKDLLEHEDEAAEHPLVAALAGCAEVHEPEEIPDVVEFDKISPVDAFTVLDADSSQLAAILRARAGQSFIIQGPPGTGKSQTIANIIAQLLFDGRKVLFVSEKMAALSMVHERLRKVGLGPFCLEIHSDKAKKRETIQRLGRALQPAGSGALDGNVEQFASLVRLRQQLNEYVRVLHEPILHGKSPFHLYAELASLEGVPHGSGDLDFAASDMDGAKEAELLLLARKLGQMPDLLLGYRDHPWFGCRLDSWSMEGQTQVAAHFGRFRKALVSAMAQVVQLGEAMHAAPRDSLDGTSRFAEFAELFSTSPAPPEPWLLGADLEDLRDVAVRYAQRFRRYDELKDGLSVFYAPRHHELNAVALDSALNSIDDSLVRFVKGAVPRDMVELSGEEMERSLTQAIEALEDIQETGIRLADALGEQHPSRVQHCPRLVELAALAARDPRPTESWLEWSSLTELVAEARTAGEKQTRLQELRSGLSAEFSDKFFELPLVEWRTDFVKRYSGLLRFLQGDYRRAMRSLRGQLKARTKLPFRDARAKVELGAELQELEQWFAERRPDHVRTLGFHYGGDQTDWSSVLSNLETVGEILQIIHGASLSQELSSALLRGGPALEGMAGLGDRLGRTLSTFDRAVSDLEVYIDIYGMDGLQAGDRTPSPELLERLSCTREELTEYTSAIRSLRDALRPGVSRDATAMASDAKEAREIGELEAELAGSRDALNAQYGHLFEGTSTRWEEVLSELDWAKTFLERAHLEDVDEDCVKAAASAEVVASTRGPAGELRSLAKTLVNEREFVAGIFDIEAVKPGGTALDNASLNDLVDWLDLRLQHSGDLSDWIQFEEVRRSCAETGLDDFVARALEFKLEGNQVEPALRKRLLIIQIDEVHRRVPLLRRFQWRDHEGLISRFKDLDESLMKVFAEWISAEVAARQPDLSGPAAGQTGFLRRELVKQRRHAPLRTLFRECGTTVTELTPCLLMSPLSVATYLPKHSVQFDVVIFDEASQMPAWDAIGAVLRGGQLIVAGDPKQLPPTTFFDRVLNDEATDDEAVDEDPLESVLDDASTIMRQCRLLWHYRSKHESLISFSNAAFYDGSLITFPAPAHPAPEGIGVRFEYVADGVYDRSRSRTNRREAERVAQLVARHCETWGTGRSLGVIALSTAQETAIREEIERLILARPDLEELLKPEGEEPFFVKPLENVQGDERDSIIISIGYGKAADGTLLLNFGPVSQDGGERRLNVAVTRARWELTLVSSLQAHDIDESRVTKDGPIQLKRYLAFAKDGRLPRDLVEPLGEPESPFEIAVDEALRARGLRVDRQVGASRYRIDLAIRDPERPGRYLLGVECDGASYHSSRVARDRDRLRQQILEGLGWKIHRIWSTDWLRDPEGALERVLKRVKKLQSASEEPLPGDYSGDGDKSSAPEAPPSDSREDLAVEFAQESAEGPYDNLEEIGTYSETPSSNRSKGEFYDDNDSDVREEILRVVEHEGPIHQELLVRRVARMFDVRRAGRNVDYRISTQIKRVVEQGKISGRDPFLWPSGMEKVGPRRPASGVPLRSISHVPPEELESAALLVVRKTRGIRPEELITEVARVLGYSRTGANVAELVERAILELIERDGLCFRGEHLTVVEGTVVGADRESRAEATTHPGGADGDSVALKQEDSGEASVEVRPVAPETAEPEEHGQTTEGASQQNPDDVAFDLTSFLSGRGIEVIDKRSSGGALWAIGGPEFSSIMDELREKGFRFQFAEGGGRSTGHRRAWFTNQTG